MKRARRRVCGKRSYDDQEAEDTEVDLAALDRAAAHFIIIPISLNQFVLCVDSSSPKLSRTLLLAILLADRHRKNWDRNRARVKPRITD